MLASSVQFHQRTTGRLRAWGVAGAIALFVAASSIGAPAAGQSRDAVNIAAPNVDDTQAAAIRNARLSLGAMQRAVRVHDAWMTRRDIDTGLFPQSLSVQEFRYQNVAADFLCFEYAIAERAELSSLPLIKETLRKERELCRGLGRQGTTALVGKFDVRTAKPLEISQRDRLFATSEYLKDGLVGLYEHTGDAQVLERIVDMVRAIEGSCATPTKFGTIPSTNSEINGNVLQACSRLSGLLDARFGASCANTAGRVADAVIGQMLAESGGVPVLAFDYSGRLTDEELSSMPPSDRPSDVLHLRDHGNETAVGLSEAFALAISRSKSEPVWKQRAERWAEPLTKMYEIILDKGVNSQGLVASRIRAKSFEMIDSHAADTWGYLLVGVYTFADAGRRAGLISESRLSALESKADAIARAVAKTDHLLWQSYAGNPTREHHDGWADTIESAIYVAHARPALREDLLAWCDSQIGYMFALQGNDGFVSGDYLDGNFIRTAMLYAEARSAGAHLEPWSSTASVGYAEKAGKGVFVVVAGAEGYEGKVEFDTARHRDRLKMPWNWPRLNAWPEWVTGRPSVNVKIGPGEVLVVP